MATLRAAWATVEDYAAVFHAEIEKGGLLVRGATADGAAAGAEVEVELKVAGQVSTVKARVAAVVPGVGVAVMFDPSIAESLAELGAGEDDEARPPAALSDRLRAMSPSEKMQLALSGSRDERAALLRDTNKMLHVYVLKNPRIGLDEVTYAAKLPLLSPDALKMIAEHREWNSSPAVCAALVRNPKTPMPLALRLLDKVPMNELRAIAKGGAREQLVHAARKRVIGS